MTRRPDLLIATLTIATLILGALHKAIPTELNYAAWLLLGACGLRIDRRTT